VAAAKTCTKGLPEPAPGEGSYQRNERLFYNSELCPPAFRGALRGLLEGYSRNIVLAPDRFTDVNSSEIVEAKIERVRQFVSFEGKLNTKAETCKIVNSAMVHGLILNQDLSGVVRPGAL
jgi:hypothetical protein